MLKLIRKLNITNKFALFLVLIGIVPLLTAGLLAYQVAKESLVGAALKDQEGILSGYRNNIVLVQEQIESLIANISGVETITNALSRPSKDITVYEQLATEVQVGYILNGYLNIKGLVSIHVSGEQGAHFQVGDTLDKRIKYTVLNQIKQQALESKDVAHWVGVSENINAGSSHKYILAAAHTMYSMDRESNQRRAIGTLIIHYRTDAFEKLFGEGTNLFLVDKGSRYLYHPDRTLIGQHVGDLRRGVLDVTQRHALVDRPEGVVYQTYQPIERSGWMLLSEVPQSTLLTQVDLIRNTTIVVFTLALVFVALVAYYFSSSFVSPLKYITHSFRRLKEGATDVEKLPVPGVDEMSQLAQWFNRFLDELRKRQESEEALRLSEERYELVSHATNEGIWDLDRTVGSFYFSDRFREITGYTSEKFAPSLMEFYRIVHKHDRADIK